MNFGYENELFLSLPMQVAASAENPIRISLDSEWLVCK